MKENITKQECSLETDVEFLRAELMDVMRLFGSDVPKVKQIFSADGYKFNNTIQIDGREYTFASALTVGELLPAIGTDDKGKAVAVNNRVVPRTSWGEHRLSDGDNVTIITAAYGG